MTENVFKSNGKNYDVIVCGGGPAGWVAAVSAARCGLRTALAEKYGFLGGSATAGLVLPISGFYYQGKRVVGGIPWEFVERMQHRGAALVELPKGHVSFSPESYKLIAQHMVAESGVSFLSNSYLAGCQTENHSVRSITVVNKSGMQQLSADCFIDATGDGDLFHFAGAPMLKTEEQQPMSLCFVLSGVDTATPLLKDSIHHDGRNNRHSCNEEIRSYLLELSKEKNIPQFGGPWFNTMLTGGCVAVNITRACCDAVNQKSYSRAELQLREDMFTFVDILRGKYPEFRNCGIVSSAVNAAVRESRHIKGLYTLTLDDFASGRKFDCPVAHCAHPMDIHSARNNEQQLIPLAGDAYIPYEALVTKEFDNLIAAGRCISAEREPYASVRVQATAMSIGEAAGILADLHCRSGAGVNSLPKEQLKQRLSERNFVL